MKLSKWMKWTLIIGAVFCLVGVGVMTCGAMMGGVSSYDVFFDCIQWNPADHEESDEFA